MPDYEVTDPQTGRTLTITGDKPPTEAELDGIFKAARQAQPDAVTRAVRAVDRIGPYSRMDRALNWLPTVGGLTGGVVGGWGGSVPGAVVGSALGGGFGQSVKELVNQARGVPWRSKGAIESAKKIGVEGATQGVAELTGQGLSRLARPVARAFMENAVRPPISLQREHPDVIDTMLNERIPVGRILPGAAKGSEQAAAKRSASGAQTERILTEATNAGLSVPAGSVARPVADLAADITKQPLSDAEIGQVSGMLAEFFKNKPTAFNPLQLKELKRAAQHIAQPIFKAQAAGNLPGPEQAIKARFNGAIAEGAKEGLESLPQGFGERVAASEGRTQRLIGAQRAARQAEMRRLPLWAEMASLGAGATAGAVGGSDARSRVESGGGTYLLIRALASPRILSRMGLVMSSQAISRALRQMPRGAVLAALNAATEAPQTEE